MFLLQPLVALTITSIVSVAAVGRFNNPSIVSVAAVGRFNNPSIVSVAAVGRFNNPSIVSVAAVGRFVELCQNPATRNHSDAVLVACLVSIA